MPTKSFINEIANVLKETGADVIEVAKGMGLRQPDGDKTSRPASASGDGFPRT